jgi:methionine-rich copper-binding protein CopC
MRRTILLAAAMVALGAAQAEAHARLVRATPRVGATVKVAPGELRLQFSESIETSLSSIGLSGPDKRPLSLGRLALDPKDHRVVVVPIPTPLMPGAYRVEWRMMSTDAHRTEGDFVFKFAP